MGEHVATDWARSFLASVRPRLDRSGPIARVRFSSFPAKFYPARIPDGLVALLVRIDRERGTLASAVDAIRSAVPGWSVEVRRKPLGGSIVATDPGRVPLVILWFGVIEAGPLGGPMPLYADVLAFNRLDFGPDELPS